MKGYASLSVVCLYAVLCAGFSAGLGGCAAGPDYRRPDVPMTDRFKEAAPSPLLSGGVPGDAPENSSGGSSGNPPNSPSSPGNSPGRLPDKLPGEPPGNLSGNSNSSGKFSGAPGPAPAAPDSPGDSSGAGSSHMELSENMRKAAELWKPAAAGLNGLPAASVSLHDDKSWWQALDDPVLDELMRRLEVNNQNILLAEAQYRQARALLGVARSDLFPAINLNVSPRRERTALGGVFVGNDLLGTTSMSWELDLWGGLRRALEAAGADFKASAGDLAAMRLSMRGQCLTAYMNLRVSDELLNLYARTIEEYEKALSVTMSQYRAGVVTGTDVAQAQTQLAAAKSRMTDLTLTRKQYEHALAVLLGFAPAQFALAPAPDLALTLPEVPEQMPSSLLERRPDIVAAEQRVAAANAQIGVAAAAFFPNVTLNLTGGFESALWHTWLTMPQRIWSVGPSLVQALFDGGRRIFQSRAAEAAYDATVAQYRQAVIAAFQEVEDALAGVRLLRREIDMQAVAVASAREALRLSMAQYRAGTVDYLHVVTAQTASLTQENAYIILLGRQWQAAVQLVMALGGGWRSQLN